MINQSSLLFIKMAILLFFVSISLAFYSIPSSLLSFALQTIFLFLFLLLRKSIGLTVFNKYWMIMPEDRFLRSVRVHLL